MRSVLKDRENEEKFAVPKRHKYKANGSDKKTAHSIENFLASITQNPTNYI